MPEAQAVFIERTAEQTLRVAACLAASECSETITDEILSAAFTLVRRSVQDAVRIAAGHGHLAGAVNKVRPSLADKVRARIELHGGRATSSQVLPYVGATAAEVKELPGIAVTVERSGKTGRPATVFTIRGDAPVHAEQPDPTPQPMPAAPEREQNRATVVQMDVYRPAPVPAPVKRSADAVAPLADNPFRALL